MPKVTRFVVLTLTILIGTLITDYCINYITESFGKTYQGVAINMVAAVAIFYPLFSILDLYIKKVSRKYIQHSKRVAGNSSLGLILGFGVALLILFVLFASVWYNLDAISYLKSIF